MRSSFSIRHVLPVLALTVLAGCSGNGDPYNRQPVRGTVLLDGAPLEQGSIVFYPQTEGAVASGTTIRAGSFDLPAAQGLPVGFYKVSISSSKPAGPQPANVDDLMEVPPDVIALVPKKYNAETTLTSEVQALDENVFDFQLTSQ